MKKNTMMRIASVLLVAVLISTCAISGTFAKYVSTATGTGTAEVAAWKFTIGGATGEFAVANTFDIDLFNESKVFDTNGNAVETDVADSRIAPGTWGYFDITLTNDSEVNANYAVNFEVEKIKAASGLNIQFVKATDPESESLPVDGWGNAPANIADTEILMTKSATIRVFWKWAYTTTIDEVSQDTVETQLGIAAANATLGNEPMISVTADITITQKD